MYRISLILVSFSLAACATGPFSQQRDLESGAPQQGKVIACSGYKSWPDCDRAAAKACANGYEVLAKEENLPTQTRTLRILCK